MRLDFETIKKITTGAVDIVDNNGEIEFSRLTEQQKNAFLAEQENFNIKVGSTASVRFDFKTDSKYLKIGFTNVRSGSSRTFYSFDVYENDQMIYSYYNNYTKVTRDEFCVKLSGDSHVQVFFPNLSGASIEYVELSDGASVVPSQFDKNIIMYGDSITHGYDATCTSLSYANIFARRLNANVVNTAIGGAIFNSDVVVKLENFTPDFITVAYGTNDWSKLTKETFDNNFNAFLEKLKATYPNVPAYFILPIWRGDCDRITGCGTFDEHRAYMKKQIEKCGYVAIDDLKIVPNDARMYSPDMLHPNDVGFVHYANALLKYIR